MPQFSQSLVFGSDVPPLPRQLDTWREEFGASQLRCGFDIPDDRPFRMRVDVAQLGDLRMSRNAQTECATFRDKKFLADGDDRIALIFARSGRVFAEHDGNHHRLRPGEMMALSVDRGGRIASTGNGAYTAVIVPRATLMPLVRAPLRFGCVISCRRSYALAYVDFVIANLDSAPDDERQLTERHLVEVMALALGATRAAEAEAAGSGLKAARLAAIITDIEAHFADPALDLDATAARAGLSARHLQTLLAEDGKTFSTEVKRRRLNRAMALLRDPGRAALRVIDIAQDCGFADVSHFNRSFRAHFGDTPNGMRTRH